MRKTAETFDFSLAGAEPVLQFCMGSIAENLERVREQIASAAGELRPITR